MSEMVTHYLCIGCPLGCRLEVEADERGAVLEVRGFSCKRGKEYAEREHVDPRRLVTATVAVRDAHWARLPVRTNGLIPKGQVRALCESLRRVEVVAPIRRGDVIVANALGTGVDVVASRDLARASGSAEGNS